MRIPANILSSCGALPVNGCLHRGAIFEPRPLPGISLRLKATRGWSCGVSILGDSGGKLCNWGKKVTGARASAFEDGNMGADVRRKRKVVEHICLLKAKEDLSEDQEKVMLDYIYTIQYYMRGVVAISLGRICDQNPECYTHAIFMRFQTKDDLANFYKNSFYLGILKEHVMPYCHGLINLDYESEVEDDILPIFRKGEEFNYGVELVLVLSFIRSSLGEAAEDAMTSLDNLAVVFPSLIVQITKGPNMNTDSTEYTHGGVIRFRSSDAFEMFLNSPQFNTMWRSKFQPIIVKAVSVHFPVDPIGTELM
ncbi:stress-response A/B barrel domain-containing protein UP3 [Andrographis paniculata]|uniref:stress-response A/B barrel domain-containing protein UP3 n=1 Tax=Andrographis paniculata TaxID=175694 RepID=UPI0021E7111A|nr:stress-response A/B barrel domain-containing protein UP3 [Andrographis paniculata]